MRLKKYKESNGITLVELLAAIAVLLLLLGIMALGWHEADKQAKINKLQQDLIGLQLEIAALEISEKALIAQMVADPSEEARKALEAIQEQIKKKVAEFKKIQKEYDEL